jgi:hypothetical protein
MMSPTVRVQDALSALLDSLGMLTMAREVLTEERPEYLARYAQAVLKWAPASRQAQIRAGFQKLGLIRRGFWNRPRQQARP